MLVIKNVSQKPCDICMAEDAVDAKFTDGFSGSVCWRCVQKMFKARTTGKETHAESEKRGGPLVA